MQRFSTVLPGVCLATALLGACSVVPPEPGGAAGAARVAGTVSLVPGEVPPAGAVLRVQLVDVSRADAAAVVLGEQTLAVGGKPPPYAYEIAYDPARIDPRYSYAVQARIEAEGRLRYINDQRHAVLTRGAGVQADLALRRVGGQP